MSKKTFEFTDNETLIEELRNRGFLVVKPVSKDFDFSEEDIELLGGKEGAYFHDLAVRLLKPIEDLLSKHNILVPSDDRTGDEGEASLYGMPYDALIVKFKNKFCEEFGVDNAFLL
jgi:hypothetical protein